MTRAIITLKIIKEALRVWRKGQLDQTPSALLDLDWLAENRTAALVYRRMEALSWGKCVYLRAALHHSSAPTGQSYPRYSTLQAAIQTIRADFCDKPDSGFKTSMSLKAWSAFYHRNFIEFPLTVTEMAEFAGTSRKQFSRYIEKGEVLFYQAILEEEKEARKRTIKSRLHQRLLPEYSELVGLAQRKTAQEIADELKQPDGSRFVSIEGPGGIGKTAVAQEVCFQVLEQEHFVDAVWISARQEKLTEFLELESLNNPIQSVAEMVSELSKELGQQHLVGLPWEDKLNGLKPLLVHRPYLIVLDNLETAQEVRELIKVLESLQSGQSRFLFTSRYSLKHFSAFVCRRTVPQLSWIASKELIRKVLYRSGYEIPLSDDDMTDIYEAVGGNPLALKLLAAQAQYFPLDLQGLREARLGSKWETMFSYIYSGSWQRLDELGKRLFVKMALVPPTGFTLDKLRNLTDDFSDSDFEKALQQLLNYSLLEISGVSQSQNYHLHRMAITFLQTNVFQNWTSPVKPND